METVRLDAEATDGAPAKPHPVLNLLALARRNLVASAATLLFLLAVFIIVIIACVGPRRVVPKPVIGDKVTTQTGCGNVQGIVGEDALIFRGIPYAQPPINELRWQTAKPLNLLGSCWNGTYLAHNSSEVCLQRNATNHVTGSEDCLYLDVYTTKVSDYSNPLPVVVMIGADTLSGPSPGIMVPSDKLARVHGIVYVRPNFRLDAFGFLAVEPLSRAARPMSSGNYGLSDIIEVLNWVQLNIQHFGGDKRLVTLWGHRAGGSLVSALIGWKDAKELFANAWISSGSGISSTRNLKESEQENKAFLDNIRCNDAHCLRKKTAEEVMQAVPQSWYAVNDGLPEKKELNHTRHEWLIKDEMIVKHHIGEIFKESLPVKVVIGTTAQSGRLPESITYGTNLTDQQMKKIISNSLLGSVDGVSDEILKRYNSTVLGLHTLISDIRVVCPLMALATMQLDIPFYISTFPRGTVADVDSDAAAILGFIPMSSPQQKRHLEAIQELFTYFVGHGKVVEADKVNRILIVDQDVLPKPGYDNCKLWIDRKLVPNYAKVD